MASFYDELRHRTFFHLSTGLEITVDSEGRLHHAKLTKEERKELKIRMRIDKLLAKSVQTYAEYNHLCGIPYRIGLNTLDVFETILQEKKKPEEAKQYLLDLERYYLLTWHG